MDANKLRTEVFEKTGIKVDTTDPIFALVALNEAVLADYATHNLPGLHDAVEKLTEQTKLLVQAGDRAKALLLQMGRTVDEPIPAQATPASIPNAATASPLPTPLLMLAGGTALVSAILVLAGQAMFASPRQAPVPAAAVVSTPTPANAPALTPEQQQWLKNGEKFAKAWPKLDTKTQAKIQSLME